MASIALQVIFFGRHFIETGSQFCFEDSPDIFIAIFCFEDSPDICIAIFCFVDRASKLMAIFVLKTNRPTDRPTSQGIEAPSRSLKTNITSGSVGHFP